MSSSKEFSERRTLIELQEEMDCKKHQRKMLELEFMRESNRIFHEQELERNRIKSAEIRKTQMRKMGYNQ